MFRKLPKHLPRDDQFASRTEMNTIFGADQLRKGMRFKS